MVIGNGLIAKAFASYTNQQNVVIFASGVSNSTQNNTLDFEREITLIKDTLLKNSNARFIYFSTCSIYDETINQSAYVQHKIHAEKIIAEQAKKYCIFRVSNLVGHTKNPTTIFNYIINCIKNNSHFYLWQYATRNLLDVADLFLIIDYILNATTAKNSIINIANPINYTVPFIVESIELYFNKKANYTALAKGNVVEIDTTFIQTIFKEIPIHFNDQYLPTMLEKYYTK